MGTLMDERSSMRRGRPKPGRTRWPGLAGPPRSERIRPLSPAVSRCGTIERIPECINGLVGARRRHGRRRPPRKLLAPSSLC